MCRHQTTGKRFLLLMNVLALAVAIQDDCLEPFIIRLHRLGSSASCPQVRRTGARCHIDVLMLLNRDQNRLRSGSFSNWRKVFVATKLPQTLENVLQLHHRLLFFCKPVTKRQPTNRAKSTTDRPSCVAKNASGTEEVVESHFGLDDAGVLVAQVSGRCHKRQMNRRTRFRQLLKCAKLSLKL